MSWLRLDDQYADHPKLLELAERDRWRWTTLLVHVARYRLNGHVTDSALRACRITPKLRAQLLDVGLLDTDAHGALTVHDWNDYNVSKRDSTNRDRQRRWRERHGITPAQPSRLRPDVTPLRNAPTVTVPPLPPVPDPVTPNPPDPPAAPPDAPAAAARRAGGGESRIGEVIPGQLERLERLRAIAGDPPAWGDVPAAWGDDPAPDGASDG